MHKKILFTELSDLKKPHLSINKEKHSSAKHSMPVCSTLHPRSLMVMELKTAILVVVAVNSFMVGHTSFLGRVINGVVETVRMQICKL